MANNYTSFSATITLETEADAIAAYAYYDSDAFLAQIAKARNEPIEDVTQSFDCTREDTTLWIRDDGESGDVEAAALFFAHVSKKFLHNAPLGLQWADTCSKQRVGEFGGGAFWTNGNTTTWCNTAFFLTDAGIENNA